jgi:hypothetical protein
MARFEAREASPILRPSRLIPALVAAALLGGGVSPALAQAYKVTLKNGNTFVTKYRPEDASYDASKITFFTDKGNRIALSKDDVADVVADIENRGFGVVIDTTTIVVGVTANDAPGEEEGEEGGEQTTFQIPTPTSYLPSLLAPGFANGFATGGFAGGGFATGGAEPTEPGSFGAGIPLSFIGGGTVPLVPAQPPN